MHQLIKQGRIASDDWHYADQEDAEGASHQVLALADYLTARAAGSSSAKALAVKLAPADDEEALLPFLADLPLIAIDFPSTGEGRGYTQGRLLRERHGYKGELRAIGAVRLDQVFLLARCGFDAFDLAPGEKPEAALAELHRFSVAYQETAGALVHPRRRYGG